MSKNEIKFGTKIINQIIRNYTREAGVRNLEKEISKVCRKAVKILETTSKKIAEAKSNLRYIHLSAHIKTTEVLSKSQIKKYNQLRGYADNPCEKIPEGHNKEMWMLHNGCN